MTFVLIAAFILFLTDNKKVKTAFMCLLPAFVLLPAFLRMSSISARACFAGLIIIGASPHLEKVLGLIKLKKPDFLTKPASDEGAAGAEDILDNKKKWRLIVAGYVIFILFAAFSVMAMFRLNTKINNIYEFSNSQQETIDEQQKLIEELREELKEQGQR